MILDANTWLGHWPFAELEPDTSDELVRHQAAHGISLSCVAPLDAVFYQDPRSANERLLRMLRSHPTLDPVPIVNPTLPTWPDELELVATSGRARQIRLVPNYHGYCLGDPRCEALLDAAARAGVRVSITLRLEDERAHHPLMQVPGVPVDDVLALAHDRPDQRFLVLTAYRAEVLKLAAEPNLLCDLAYVEHLDTLNDLLRHVPAERVVFGSHTPFLTTRAELVKLEQCTARASTIAAVAAGNLATWLGGAGDEAGGRR